MEKLSKKINQFKIEITDKINSFNNSIKSGAEGKVTKKADKTLVTEVDLFITTLIKKIIKEDEFKKFSFYCEEDYENLSYPSIILDPIDGTRELVAGIGECCVSLAIMYSSSLEDNRNSYWLYNPFTGQELKKGMIYSKAPSLPPMPYFGMVSRSEWKKSLYGQFNLKSTIISPRGSIANKLALLAMGSCDFVLSLRPKNIWDIAGGSLALRERGIYLYEKGQLINELDKPKYDSPLCWCSPDIWPTLKTEFAL